MGDKIWGILSLVDFVAGGFCHGGFFAEDFVMGAFVTGDFVMGDFDPVPIRIDGTAHSIFVHKFLEPLFSANV